MAKTLFSTYTLQFREEGTKGYPYQLDDLSGIDAYTLLSDFIKYLAAQPINLQEEDREKVKKAKARKSLLRLGSKVAYDQQNRRISCLLESGVSGRKGKISNVSKNEDMYELQEDDAHILPLFCHIDLPAQSDTAYVIMQKDGSHGMKDLFYRSLRWYLKKKNYRWLRPEFRGLLLPHVMDTMLKDGVVEELILQSRKAPKEIDKALDKTNGDPGFKVQTVLKNSKGLPVQNIIMKHFYKDSMEAMHVTDPLDDYEEISFKVKHEGQQKTFHKFQDSRNLPDLDISKRVEYDKNGMPKWKSLKAIAEKEIEEMKAFMKPKGLLPDAG